jgi:branched-chain amino acid transport system ATP-binding protein
MKQTSGTEQIAETKQEPLLKVDNLVVRYGLIHVLSGISLTVNKGEIVALIGPNGAGKSSLMQGISGILPIAKGKVVFEGKTINGLSPEKIVRMGISFTPEGRMLFNKLTVLDNLKLSAYGHGMRQKKDIEKALERVYQLFPRLSEREQQFAGQLSGGEAQMLAIGRALMFRPKLFMVDEPSLGLAPVLVKELMNSLTSLKEQGTTIIIAEQNVYAALGVADRGYVLSSTGRIVMEGLQSELRGSEVVKSAYLGIH